MVAIRGEPLTPGHVGVRVRVQLNGCPSRAWSRQLQARLAAELVGHAAVGHLRLGEIIQGDEIVLDGVEQRETAALANALRRTVDATNSLRMEREQPHNDSLDPSVIRRQAQADAIACEFASQLEITYSAR